VAGALGNLGDVLFSRLLIVVLISQFSFRHALLAACSVSVRPREFFSFSLISSKQIALSQFFFAAACQLL
jgi:hypothetical protein